MQTPEEQDAEATGAHDSAGARARPSVKSAFRRSVAGQVGAPSWVSLSAYPGENQRRLPNNFFFFANFQDLNINSNGVCHVFSFTIITMYH